MGEKKGEKEPDKVTHKEESGIPLMPPGVGPSIHTTTIYKDGKTYTGLGRTEEEANKSAGDKYSNGKSDQDKK